MKRLTYLAITLFAVITLLLAACGGDDDDDDDSNGGSADTPTEASDDGSSDGDGQDDDGSDDGDSGNDDQFRVNGTGVLTVVVDGETHEFDVGCTASLGITLDVENDLEELPLWTYNLNGPTGGGGTISGHHEVVDGEPGGFTVLSVEAGGLVLFADDFTHDETGATSWSGTFTTLQGPVVEFETSCS